MSQRPRYSVVHDPAASDRFPWIVVDASGEPVLWRKAPKVGRVPLRFRTQGAAQTAADRLTADGK